MEVLASADEAMPALAERLAGVPQSTLRPSVPAPASAPSGAAVERPVGAPQSASAPALLSHPPSPSNRVGMPEQPAASVLYPVSAPAATLGIDHVLTSEQAASHMQTCQVLSSNKEPAKGAGVAEPTCSIVTDEASPGQASAPATEAGGGLGTRAMSSAALSESPAALAMPAREELPQE